MEATLCLPFMMREMKSLTEGHIIAELMLIFAFAYMIEGASGFGTPVALGAPMLASLGHPKFGSVVTLLAMNTFATVWGAAGTPIWFGFGNIGLTEDEYVEISFKSGVCLTICAYLILPVLVLTILCPFSVIRKNFLFVLLALSSVMIPVLALSFVTFEFPSLIGGMVGCIISAGLIRCKLGLKEYTKEGADTSRHMKISTTASQSLVQSIAKTNQTASKIGNDIDEELEALAKEVDEDEVKEGIESENGNDVPPKIQSENGNDVPPKISSTEERTRSFAESFTPHLYEDSRKDNNEDLADLSDVDQALGPRKSGAAYYRELIGRTSPLWGTVLLLIVTRVQQIGLKELLTLREPYFQIDFGTYGIFRLSASLGSFFSGSTTISNLTFGGIQKIAAETIGTSYTSMLALQAVGASAGNGVCLNNIIAACTVVGLNISEGKIIAQTFKPVLAIALVSTIVICASLDHFLRATNPTVNPSKTNPEDNTCVHDIALGKIMYERTTVTTFLSVATPTATAGPLRRISSVYASTAVPRETPTVRRRKK
eukprot:scaffold45368_cov68-Cyclotella_meneghiniana.AAC.4